MAQLMPLPLTVSCFSKIQIGFTFLVPAHLGSPGHRAVKRVYIYIFSYMPKYCDVLTVFEQLLCCVIFRSKLELKLKYAECVYILTPDSPTDCILSAMQTV